MTHHHVDAWHHAMCKQCNAPDIATDSRPLAARLTARENARVAKATTARIGHNPDRTKAEYLAELWITARELYPAKVADR